MLFLLDVGSLLGLEKSVGGGECEFGHDGDAFKPGIFRRKPVVFSKQSRIFGRAHREWQPEFYQDRRSAHPPAKIHGFQRRISGQILSCKEKPFDFFGKKGFGKFAFRNVQKLKKTLIMMSYIKVWCCEGFYNQHENFLSSSPSTPKTSNHPLINAKLLYKLLAIYLQKQPLLRCNFSVQPKWFSVHLRVPPTSVYFSSFSTQFGPINYVEANLKLSIYSSLD